MTEEAYLRRHWCCRALFWVDRWSRAGDTRDLYEFRLFLGRDAVVVVLRARLWTQTIATATARYDAVWQLTTDEWRITIMSFLRKATPIAEGRATRIVATDGKLAKDCPALAEYLTATSYPDGTERRTSSLTVFTEDGQWKACLNEREQGLVLFGTGKTLQGSLTALEALLTAEETPWRASRGEQGKAKRGQGKSP